MVCNVNHFSWPGQDDENASTLASFSRPLPPNPHPNVPYVVVLLKLLSVADDLSDEADNDG